MEKNNHSPLLAVRDELLQTMEAAVDAFDWADTRTYADYLAQTYYYASHSVAMLGAMLARTPPTDTEFYRYIQAAIREELNHEALAHNDLEALGLTLADYPELPSCRLLYEPQFFKAEHVSPKAVAGYIFMLESLAVTRARQMQERTARPDASSFLVVHEAKDAGHAAAIAERILAFGPDALPPILDNMRQTGLAYVTMLQEITARRT